ncbi:Pimeloyl-ACP methyl ester carboxylesterase [Lachnospiraceae bacterium]|nr:Pimeloyl-ACP methyl ester carboxylesterase [Lachnospiraceae bacterium]
MGYNIVNGCVDIDDTDMYYVSFGRGKKKMVMLPGLSDGLSTVKGKGWILVSPYKKYLKDYTVYMFSRKNKMPEGYSISDMADDQIRVMKKLGIEKAYVCGVSQGGMIAQYIAINYPEVVEKLILAVTTPSVNDVAKGAVSGWIEMAERGDHTELMVDTAEKTYSEKYLKKNRKFFPIIAKFTKPSSYERFDRNAKAILKFDMRDRLSEISAPTYIIAGDDDKTVGNDAVKELMAGISNSEHYIYAGLGHGVFDEAKDFYDRIFAFCDK